MVVWNALSTSITSSVITNIPHNHHIHNASPTSIARHRYHELPSDVLETLKNVLSYGLGRELVDLMFRVMKFATRSLSHLGQEMLFLTKKSRGGFILMFMLFYIAYVLGATMWIETAHSNLGDFCLTLGSCTYTMIRLTFFDGNGFDFAYSLVEGHPILFGITCLYVL